MTALLTLKDVCAGYGGSVVLDGLSLQVNEGEVVCLLGANGAGKTTATRVICGLVKPTAGDLTFAGKSLLRVPSYDRVNEGICLSPEGRQVFPDMTVRENLLLGAFCKRAKADRAKTLDEVLSVFPRLAERALQKAGLMSGGEQQMLAIGRALMGKPRLLMLDEPSLGLAPKLVMDVYEAVSKTAKLGISILIVEQNAEVALAAADRGYVLADGHIAASGSAAELRGSKLVQEAFLGASQAKRNSTRDRRRT
ncbi:MAG: ABC transporter ATP-binding protein [Rhizobiales bacterium]|nr:ABC transporter ATP-binding protein [Hyphomicrobiales bacterium]